MARGTKTLLNEAEVAVEYRFQSTILAEYGIDIAENLQGEGWENYFKETVEVYPKLICEFWQSAVVSEIVVVGKVLGKK